MIKKDYVSYETALNALLKSTKPWDRVENVAITEALGRVLAKDIVAKQNYPKSPIASMDGYACRYEDIKNKRLKIVAKLPAGSNKEIEVGKNECVKTFTGSLLSKNCDTLIPIENVALKEMTIEILKSVDRGFAVRDVGESYKKDELLLKKGTTLSYSQIALLAELGEFCVTVFAKPKVAILATGSEIKDLGEPLENDAQIRSSNHIALFSMLRLLGCETALLPIVKDEKELVKEAILNGCNGSDILITTGGVSVGDYDFVKEILGDGEMIVNGVAIKPGRHLKIAKFNDKFIFGLPGFPYSAMVTATLFIREFLNHIFGLGQNYRIRAIIDEDYERKSPFLELVACNLYVDEKGQNRVNLSGKKRGSSAIISNLNNDAMLLMVPKELKGYKSGDVVEVLKML
ncbi:molybdopterin molybdotransferase MoeA [uncultured Campylobacter sp.]|uniref:molybdopterin molybdotransferase MoeA n=1 Tax=uncultured Campylobacter sp. TaxID=218934 RepID=UPI002616A5B9|nr:molybdopterin molybdotransferase MoeA [uncultured Campylobacter sp.]